MGIAERKERDKEELRERILVAAKTLFLEKGVEKTSIRNIADLIEYSPGSIYHYFKDKNEIFHALHQGGFQQLMSRMEVLAAVSNPMERLKKMGAIYVDFALENPDMYDLMFIKEAPMDHVFNSNDEQWKEGFGTKNVSTKGISVGMRKKRSPFSFGLPCMAWFPYAFADAARSYWLSAKTPLFMMV